MDNDKVLIAFWPTSKCNLQCKYCYASENEKKEDMDIQTAYKVIDHFKDNFMKLQFAGGEPLLNYDLICNIYRYIKEKGYKASFQIQTNGTLIDMNMAKELKHMNIAMGVSMDGPPDINEQLRGKTENLSQGIQCLARAGIDINLNCVVSSINVSRLSELADVALYFGNVKGIGIDLLRNVGRAKENCGFIKPVSYKQLREGLISLYERCEFLYKHCGVKVHVRPIEEAKMRLKAQNFTCNKVYCYAAAGRSYVVLPNGDIYPCGSIINSPEYYMGNLNKDEVIQSIALPQKPSSECTMCKYYSICSGGCPSRMIANGDDFVENSLDCSLKKISFEIAESIY